MTVCEATPAIETSPQPASAEELDRAIAALIDRAGLGSNANRFFVAAKGARSAGGQPALRIARYWRDMTKTFMFTTMAGIGVMSRAAAEAPEPSDQFLAVIQTAVRVISDDLNNVLPVFAAAAPQGVGGIHYVWWERSVLRPVAAALGLDPSDPLPPLTPNIRGLLDNMLRLAAHPLGAAIQLRVVEAIALDICIAFKRVYSRLAVGGAKVFTDPGRLAWMNSHIQAEVAHHQQVSDGDAGMTTVAATQAEREEMLRLAAEYAQNWNAALEDFAAALE